MEDISQRLRYRYCIIGCYLIGSLYCLDDPSIPGHSMTSISSSSSSLVSSSSRIVGKSSFFSIDADAALGGSFVVFYVEGATDDGFLR